MSAIFRKTAKGDIEVQVVADNTPVLLTRSFRMVEGFRVDLAQWLDVRNSTSWIALRNPCLPLLNNLDSDDEFGCTDDCDDACSAYVYYKGVVLLRVPELTYSSDPHAWLFDLQGRALAGSNIYGGSYNLCLGDSFNPLTLQPAEHLMHNEANTDLGWKGGMLQGSLQDNLFHISSWPSITHLSTPPAAIIADIKRWWPT